MTPPLQTGKIPLPGDDIAQGRAEALLRFLAQRTAWTNGTEYFRELLQGLAEALQVPCAFATEFLEQDTVARPVGCWYEGDHKTAADYPLAGTACATVLGKTVAAVPEGLALRFPNCGVWIETLRAESYLAAPMIGSNGLVVGHVAVIDRKARAWSEAEIAVLQMIGIRTASEIECVRNKREIDSAETSNRARLAHLSHELRTPLNGILGYAQLLARDPTLDARHIETVNKVRKCGERLLELINEIPSETRTPVTQTERQPGIPAERPRSTQGPAPEEGALPPDLLARMIEQSRRGDIAELNLCLDDLDREATHPQLLAVLRAHARAFDMKSIRERLGRVRP